MIIELMMIRGEEGFPNLSKDLNNKIMVMVWIEREKAAQQILQIRSSEDMLLYNHLHHWIPEIGVRIAGALHHRQAVLHRGWHLPRVVFVLAVAAKQPVDILAIGKSVIESPLFVTRFSPASFAPREIVEVVDDGGGRGAFSTIDDVGREECVAESWGEMRRRNHVGDLVFGFAWSEHAPDADFQAVLRHINISGGWWWGGKCWLISYLYI